MTSLTVCEETYRWSSGTLQSPSYPDSYGGRKQCTYIIEQWEGYVVTLEFTHFNLGDDTDCQGQYIEVSFVQLCYFMFLYYEL